jgi:hypothetical protein
MPAEPITFFSHKLDPAGVARVLRGLAPNLKMVGSDEDWQRIDISESRGLLRKAATIRFNNDPSYYTGAEWERQRSGMLGYYSQLQLGPLWPRVAATINCLQFAVATIAQPEIDLESDDPRVRYVQAVARHLDAVLFTPSALRDARGRVLAGPGGKTDPAAVWPAVTGASSTAAPLNAADDEADEDEDERELQPPTPQRVARRALSLAAVAGRALLEQEDPSDAGVEETRQRINAWVDAVGIRDELEPDEEKLLRQGLGAPEQQAAIDGCWRLEGLAVLAWALGQFELPRHDETIDPPALLRAVHVLDAAAAKGMIAGATLRPFDQLKAMADKLLAIHWRLRQFRVDGGQPIEDWPSKATNAWFPLNLDDVPLKGGDLALGETAIANADAELFNLASSIAQERHQAINWLAGDSEIYSETDTPT